MSEHDLKPITFVEFADSVRAALIEFGHTGNMELVNQDDLHRIYNEACDVLGQEHSRES